MTDAGDRTTRAAYDAVACDYARLLPDMSVEAPVDRAVLTAFVEMVQEGDGGVVADVGCGSGRVSAHLADAGLRMIGLDLSFGMARAARGARPDLPLAVGDAAALPLRSRALGGVVAWYSLIHLPSQRLPGVCAEFARVTRPGAPVVLGFQSGDGERVQRTSAYGHPVPLTSYRHRVEDVATALVGAGFVLDATVRREPLRAHESASQAFLLARRAEDAAKGTGVVPMPFSGPLGATGVVPLSG